MPVIQEERVHGAGSKLPDLIDLIDVIDDVKDKISPLLKIMVCCSDIELEASELKGLAALVEEKLDEVWVAASTRPEGQCGE